MEKYHGAPNGQAIVSMKLLDRYIIRKYLSTFVVMLGMFIPISVLVDLSQKIDKFKQYELTQSEILSHYYDFVWVFGYMLFPIFLFLSVIWFTSKLASNTEVIAILSSGVSFYRYLRPFVIAATFIALLAFGASMFWVPNASERYNDFEYTYINKNQKVRLTENIYKQLSENDFVYMSNYNANRKIGYNFTWEHFEGDELQYKIKAQNIRWVEKDSLHRLTKYFQRSILNDEEFIRNESRLDTLFNFDLDELVPVTYKAQTLNFFELNYYIKVERENGSPLINHHLLVRHKRWAIPISAFILTLIAVAVASFKKRGGMGVNLAMGIILAFLYIFFDKIFEVMVEKSNFTPWIAAWTPNTLFAILSIYLLRYAKR